MKCTVDDARSRSRFHHHIIADRCTTLPALKAHARSTSDITKPLALRWLQQHLLATPDGNLSVKKLYGTFRRSATRSVMHEPRTVLHVSRTIMQVSRSVLHEPRSIVHASRTVLHVSRTVAHASRTIFQHYVLSARICGFRTSVTVSSVAVELTLRGDYAVPAKWVARTKMASRVEVRLTPRGRAILELKIVCRIRGLGVYRGLRALRSV